MSSLALLVLVGCCVLAAADRLGLKRVGRAAAVALGAALYLAPEAFAEGLLAWAAYEAEVAAAQLQAIFDRVNPPTVP